MDPDERPQKGTESNVQQVTKAIPTGSRAAPKVAWLLCGVALALVACAVAFAILNRDGFWESTRLLALVSSALVGGVVASRRPTNLVGWFLLISADCFAVTVWTEAYATYGLLTDPGSLPLAEAMAWPPQWVWVPGAVLILVFLPLYFPDGRLVSPRWRWVVGFAMFFSIFLAVSSAFLPGDVQDTGLTNPLGAEALGLFLYADILPLWLGLLFVSAASLVVRFRRSATKQRQQIKWLAFVASTIPVWFLVSAFFESKIPVVFEIGETLVFTGVPVAVGVAILKHRLYDIDLIINRALVYGALTACVVGIYVLVVGYLGQLFQVEDNLLISLMATGVVAVLFQPLRSRLQRYVNRLMYGERDDPYAVISRLGERLESALAPDAVLPAIVGTIREALKLPYAAIALPRDDGFEVAASSGEPVDDPLCVPLTYQGATVGELLLGPRAPGEEFSDADRRLLEDLAHHAGVAVHGVRVMADLQRSRERLVLAREEERRRLRRDLHDELAPTLAALGLSAATVGELIESAPKQATTANEKLRAALRDTVGDVRRLAYDLRPPALDDLGLVEAVKERAARFGSEPRVTVEATGLPETLPAAVEVAAYRIVQEALMNVSRHAGASTCNIRLACPGIRTLEIEIVDDGIGLPDAPGPGVGLRSMRERAAELGGSCEIGRSSSSGARVFARLPLAEDHTQEGAE
ncbi:hypothetical protein BH23ACT11_BH23ACT11_13370 [soil metagenome]